MQYLHAVFERARDAEKDLTILLLDLDNFKHVVEARGHVVAAELIDRVGKNLADAVKPDGRVVHAGGDEFMVLLPKTTDEQAQSTAKHLRGWVGFVVGVGAKHLSASVGIVHGVADADLLARAEHALRVAKTVKHGTAMGPISTLSASVAARLPAPSTALSTSALRDPLTHLFTRPRLWHDLRATLHESTHSVAVAMSGQAARQATSICRAVQHHVRKQRRWGEIACRLSIDFGLAHRDAGTTTPQAMVQQADKMLLQAKSSPG